MKLTLTPPDQGWICRAEGGDPTHVGRGDYEGDALLDFLLQYGSELTGPLQIVDPDHPEIPPPAAGARVQAAPARPGTPPRR